MVQFDFQIPAVGCDQVQYLVDESTATGTCGTCIMKGDRSLVANLAAANNYKVLSAACDRFLDSCQVAIANEVHDQPLAVSGFPSGDSAAAARPSNKAGLPSAGCVMTCAILLVQEHTSRHLFVLAGS